VKVFLQGKDESIVINGDIVVTVLRVLGDEVLLGIDAPEWLAIDDYADAQIPNHGEVARLPAR
jgi:hypothetical protein